jgi:hypothetical protein
MFLNRQRGLEFGGNARKAKPVREDHAAYITSWLSLWRRGHNSSNREVLIM